MRNKDLRDLLAKFPDDIDVGTVAFTGRNTITGAFIAGHEPFKWLALAEQSHIPQRKPTRSTESVDLPESIEGDGPDAAPQERPNQGHGGVA